ncbi:hypothetical protein [[Mycobacterium] crassicus]|uniref:Low molecular weight antigen MTB12-like C-terminal domain-containing protein n=1 Tax=[Mycobacterium] crassicus TaxID=2872309 RepID=A0ABU5XF42_9MYCO|nr:hypothetical protein [Mycolicibacter sp. MYC098]MEB3020920.1 hypothetical protein [Mycolicibacter sp. MYC098]
MVITPPSRRLRISAILVAATLTYAPGAHADPEPPLGAAVPTAEQVTAILNQLTDPNVPDADKAKLVEGGLSPEEMNQSDQGLAKLDRHHALPFTFTVTDIQPAINDMAGVTAALTGPREPLPVTQPLVLADHNGTWQLTHDSYEPTFANMVRHVIHRVGPHSSPGGNVAVFGW